MKKTERKTYRNWLLAAVLAALCLTAADSRWHLELTRYEIALPGLPPELEGLRIVHLSDLHGARFGPGNRRLTELLRLEKPDIVALTGDFAGNRGQLGAVEELLRGLPEDAASYYITGNHEWAGGVAQEMKTLMARYGVTCLENGYVSYEKNGARITVAGVEDPNAWAEMKRPEELAAELRRARPEDFVLWLGHRNYWVKYYPDLPVDLILSGHAHGGIVRLPGLGGLLNVEHRLGADYEAGLYWSGSYCMEVSRGLGNSIPIPRLFNRPELVSLVLRCG